MKIKINKQEIIEEAIVNYNGSKKFKIDNMDKVGKFSRRGIKAINNINPEQFKKQMTTIGYAPVIGAVGGTLLGSQVEDADEDTYNGTGGLLGAAAGITAAAKGVQKISTPANTAKFKERVVRDGFQPDDKYNKIVDQANTLAHQYNLRNNLIQARNR